MEVAAAGKPRVVYAEVFSNPKDRIGTVAWVLERYWKEMSQGERPLGSSMTYRLRAIQRMPIGKMMAADIVSHDVIEFCRWRRAQVWHGKQITPTTVGHDVAMLVVAFKYARAAWKECSDLNAAKKFDKAKPFLLKHNLVGKSTPRHQRPTPEIEATLDAGFERRNKRANTKINMKRIRNWQIASGRRISETCRLEWLWWGYLTQTMLVKNMKDPKRRDKHKIVALTNDAQAMLLDLAYEMDAAGPKAWSDPQPRIFPYNHRSCIAAYCEEKKKAGIKKEHVLHDNRREAGSRLVDKGFSSTQAILVTGHDNTQVFDRVYNKPKPELFSKLMQERG